MLLGGAGRAPAQDAGQAARTSAVPTQDASDSNFDYAAVKLRVGVWTDKADDEVYRKGDQQTVSFEVNEDAYAVVYRIDTEGGVTVLWPRTRMDDGFVFGGHDYVLPVQGGPQSAGSPTARARASSRRSSRATPSTCGPSRWTSTRRTRRTRYDYRVTGDPFLAINEVNYAITGLENADDYVVTNYAAYYVHREVDHPRYLCSQCHLDDGTNYDPYNDTCKLNITVDYRWSNSWWSTATATIRSTATRPTSTSIPGPGGPGSTSGTTRGGTARPSASATGTTTGRPWYDSPLLPRRLARRLRRPPTLPAAQPRAVPRHPHQGARVPGPPSPGQGRRPHEDRPHGRGPPHQGRPRRRAPGLAGREARAPGPAGLRRRAART